MERVFYVTANGEPLGIMTMKDAFAWSFEHGHVTLVFEGIDNHLTTFKTK